MATTDAPLVRTAGRVIFGGMATEKQATSYRLSEDAKRLVAALAKKLGVTQTSVLELAIRALAKRERVR